MRYKRFEDLPVWNTAIDLAVSVFALTSQPPFKSQHSRRDQMERAAVSVCNNIAEGFERGTNNELLMFLYIARGPAGEVRAGCCLLESLRGFADLNSELHTVKSKAESCSKQIKAWAETLQNSGYKGERYVNDKLKRSELAGREREEFLKELAEIK